MKGRKKELQTVGMGILITVLLAALMSMKFSPTEIFEDKLLDFGFKIRGKRPPPIS